MCLVIGWIYDKRRVFYKYLMNRWLFLKIRFRKDLFGLVFLLWFLNVNKRLYIYIKDLMCLFKMWYLKFGINVFFKNYGMLFLFWRGESVNLKYN